MKQDSPAAPSVDALRHLDLIGTDSLGNAAGEGPKYLSTMPARRRDYALAIGVAVVSSIIFAALAPFAQLPLPKVPAFIPIYESALVINDLVTAVLLLSQFRILRSKSLAVLACGYIFTALMTVVHALTFPGLFAPGGLLGAGPQSTAWIYMFWHGGFPLFVVGYALLKDSPGNKIAQWRHARLAVPAGFAAVFIAVVAFAQLATSGQDQLPSIMRGNNYTPAMIVVVTSVWACSLVALVVLWRRRPHTVLDLWLMVVMCAWIFDIALAAVLNAGRFDLGFYAGRIYGLLAASFVLVVMLLENEWLYIHLAEMHEQERKKTKDLQELSVQLKQHAEERRQAIDALTLARSEAEQANRAKSAFLATMSHEIRTPMNGVIGMAEVLARTRLTLQQADLVKTIRESATVLLSLIDDILDFSKIEAGRLEIDRAPLSIDDLAEGICNSLLPVAARGGVELSLFIAPEIPDYVLSDDVRLRQILYNLVGNAIKFSSGRPGKHGQVTLRVLAAQQHPLRLAFVVADNGIGMSADTLDHLFMPFTQAEISTTRRFGGTGLGLAICKRLVELMQGELTVDSAPGKGSTFSVILPFDVAAEHAARPLPDLSGLDCIVMGKTESAAADLRTYLEHAGARVHFADDAQAVLRMAGGMDAPVVVVQDAGSVRPFIDPRLAGVPHVRHLIICRGRQRRGKSEYLDAVMLDGEILRRRALVRAVAVAAGRASPDITDDSAADHIAGNLTRPPTIDEARAQGRLILIAEDDDVNRKVILQQLALLGHAAVVARNGKEALDLWRSDRYGMLLTDLHMPEMDGYTLAESIRREEAGRTRMPILALTANALRGESNRALAAGMDEFLTKPVQLARLQAALEKWLLRSHPAPHCPPAIEPPAGNAAVLDVTVLKSLVGDNDSVVNEFLSYFRVSAQQLARELHAAANPGEVAAVTHKLKSSSRSVGALVLGDLCEWLEKLGKAGDAAAIEQGMPRFDAALADVEAAIAAYLEEHGRSHGE